MSDLVLEIAPGYTVRGFLAADQTDPVCTGFSIFEFLDTIARRHKPYSTPGGGFSQAYWQRIANHPCLVNMPIFWANLLTSSGRRRHPFQVTTASGLLLLLTVVETRLPNAKEQPQPKPPAEQSAPLTPQEISAIFADPVRKAEFIAKLKEHNNPTPIPKQKINAELNATVADTLERFIAGDRSKLRVIDAAALKHEQNSTPQPTTSNHLGPKPVLFRCAGRVVMGTHHPDIDEPVFSVYAFIDITRNPNSDESTSFYYTRKLWKVATKQKLPFVREAVLAHIRCNLHTIRMTVVPALPMSKLEQVVYFLVNYTKNKKKTRAIDESTFKHNLYEPISQNTLIELSNIFRKFEKGDSSFIKECL
jgi:hypothetical protein